MYLTKQKLRENCLQKLKKSRKINKTYDDLKLNRDLLKEFKNLKNKKILFYYPLKIEVDIRKSLNYLRRKHQVYTPFMEEESFKMVTFRLPLKEKKFGIFEAGNTLRKIKKVDIVIVPIIGVDINLQRIGFGKGMYDRFFSKLQQKPYTIFIQRELCFAKESICDSYDVSCDLLLTPKIKIRTKSILKNRKNNVKRYTNRWWYSYS